MPRSGTRNVSAVWASRFSTSERAPERICESPQTLPRLEGGPGSHDIRRHRLRRFPYAVIYLCLPDEVLVIAMAHLHRRPLYWLDRLGS